MKKNLLLVAFLMFSFGLFAQWNEGVAAVVGIADFRGTWTGEAVKNGQPMGFKLQIQKDGRFTLAYDLNPNDLSIKGRLKATAEGVVFEVETTYIKLKKVSSRKNAKGFAFIFKKNGRSTTYAQGAYKGVPIARQLKKTASMFGWDEGVAAVVINHEEQYSLKR